MKPHRLEARLGLGSPSLWEYRKALRAAYAKIHRIRFVFRSIPGLRTERIEARASKGRAYFSARMFQGDELVGTFFLGSCSYEPSSPQNDSRLPCPPSHR